MSLIRLKSFVGTWKLYLGGSGELKNYNYVCGFNKRFIQTTSNKSDKQELSYIHRVGKEPLIYRNIGQQLALSAEKYKDREALVSCHENIRITFAELKEKADRLAVGFHKMGLEKGDLIGIWGPNSSNWLITMYGAARAGLILVGLNPAFQVREMDFCIKKVGIKAIFAPEGFKTQNYYKMLTEIIPELSESKPGQINSKKVPLLKSVIINSDQYLPGAFKFNEISQNASASELREIEALQNLIQPDSGCNMQFTSGTTGQPKAALLSHFSFVNNSYQIGIRNELNEGSPKICLMQVPLFHAFGIVIANLAGVHHGATLVLPGASFNPKESVDAIMKEKCSILYGTPTMYVDLVKKIRENPIDLISPEIAVTGGSPCSPKLFKDIKEVLGVKKLKTVFGLTETTAVTFQTLPTDEINQILETVGHIQEHTEAKVIDVEGNTVPFGTPGELCIRAYSTMLKYFHDDDKTNEIIDSAKWLKTGDQFILYETGYGKIVGRIKDLIIRGGENIFPKEIEDFLNTHPDIIETHVIGIPDERLGEEVCAFIRLKENKLLSLDNMKLYCKGQIAHYKIPRFLRVVDEFPKTASGKVQKFKLKHEFQRSISF